MKDMFCCPSDQHALQELDQSLVCPKCGARYEAKHGVYRFVDTDEFYEGHYKNQIRYAPRKEGWWQKLLLWTISNGYVWEVRKHVSGNSRVVEVGCAGGVAYFGNKFEMIGVDLSLSSLALARKKYAVCLQANAVNLPIVDGTIDAVISSYLWEHIHPSQKPIIAAELFRVLKPGGKIVFLYDVATKNPLISKLKHDDIELYNMEFLDSDGHLGYQSIPENEEIFRSIGFIEVETSSMERTIFQSPSVIEKATRWPTSISILGKIFSFTRNPYFHNAYLFMLRLIDTTIGRSCPESWGRIAMTVAQRPK